MNNKFIVGVMGTQNTGKSTFIQDILYEFSETSMQFRTVGCDYRKKIEEKGLRINRTGNLMSQRIIMDTLLEQLDIIGKMPDGNYITDRTPLDAYVYTIYLQRHRPELGITEQNLDGFLADVLGSLGKYDALIFLLDGHADMLNPPKADRSPIPRLPFVKICISPHVSPKIIPP